MGIALIKDRTTRFMLSLREIILKGLSALNALSPLKKVKLVDGPRISVISISKVEIQIIAKSSTFHSFFK
jgi:hypothetical protein